MSIQSRHSTTRHLSFRALCLTLALMGCKTTESATTESQSSEPQASDVAAQSTAQDSGPDESQRAEMVAGQDYSLGACSVKQIAPADPCGSVRGKTATGVAPGCTHDNCTAAKANARQNLLTGIPAACGAYIDCGNPCRCIQK